MVSSGSRNVSAEVKPQTVGGRYLTGVKLEKSAQLLWGLDVTAGPEFHADSGGALEEEEGDTAGLLGLRAGAVDVPVSMGMSSKLAVHTGPLKDKTPEDEQRHFSAWRKMQKSKKLFKQINKKNLKDCASVTPTCVNFHSVVSTGVGGFKRIPFPVFFLRVRALLTVCAAGAPVTEKQ